MLWEADEKNDGVIDWDELQLMFQRCVRDASGREPASLYYVIQFLIFDQDADGLVGIDDTMSILYARMGAEKMEQIINELFRDSRTSSDDGASASSNQGRGRGHSGKLDFVSFHKAWSKVLLGDRTE
jgi:Ca2+-binding EF-hand superfamily protein